MENSIAELGWLELPIGILERSLSTSMMLAVMTVRHTWFQTLRSAICQHITVLCQHLFLSQKPPKPTQSRRTGVAGVARWAFGLASFHRCLGPVLQSLHKSQRDDKAGGDAASLLDNDARAPKPTPCCRTDVNETRTEHYYSWNSNSNSALGFLIACLFVMRSTVYCLLLSKSK